MALFSALIGPPDEPSPAKWLGLGISIPSSLHKIPLGEFPRTTMSLFPSALLVTPAKLDTIRAGSLKVPA